MDGRKMLEHIAGLKDNIRKYFEAKISYYGVLAFEKAMKLLSVLIANFVIITLGFLALVFFSGAAAIWLGMLLGNTLFGLLIIGGFYFLLAMILFLWRKNIFGRIAIKILTSIFIDEDTKNKDVK